jgi:hypothetical protein
MVLEDFQHLQSLFQFHLQQAQDCISTTIKAWSIPNAITDINIGSCYEIIYAVFYQFEE